MKKIDLKILSCSLQILKTLPVTRFKNLKQRFWHWKSFQEAACNELILAQWEVGTREHRPITEKGILNRVSVMLLILHGSEKRLKDLENHQRITSRLLSSSAWTSWIFGSVW
jgi:hypothetical protein